MMVTLVPAGKASANIPGVSLVTVWSSIDWLIQVTCAPAGTVMELGMKA